MLEGNYERKFKKGPLTIQALKSYRILMKELGGRGCPKL